MSIILSFLASLITVTLFKFIHNVILTPYRIQQMMRSQGIFGPSYKLIHGSTKESLSLKQQAARDANTTHLSHDIFPRVQPNFYAWMKQHGKNFVTWNGPRPHLVVTEANLAREILTNKDEMFPKIKVDGPAKKMLGDGLVITEGGEKWAKLRKLANIAFYAESLKGMIPAMIASVETMLENWRMYEGKEIDVYDEFKVLSSEVISRTAFGSSYLEGKNIFDMLTKLGFLIFKNADKVRPWGIGKILKSQDDIESDKIERSLHDSIKEIIRKREEKVLSGEAENYGSDFLGLLLKAHHAADKNSRISIQMVIDECKVFFLAGHETTSSLLAWTFLLLAVHTDWQDKARTEVLQLFGQQNPTPEGLPRMKTASMIINECLRLYAPAISLVRRVKRKLTAGKYEFPDKMEIHVPVLALHRDADIWGSDAHLFKPERFADGVAAATRNNPMALVPFGFGPRTCVGLNFANNEAKIALAMILQRYKFTLSSNYVHSPISLVTTRPLRGVQVVFQPLANSSL